MDKQQDWDIRQIQELYSHLRLSREQALAVYQMDQKKMTLGLKMEYFSHWEERDYNYDRWRGILDADQLKAYEEVEAEQDRKHEEWLVQTDTEREKEVALNEEWIAWQTDVFIPGLRREALQTGILFVVEREKIHYLRQEYQGYLERHRQSTIVRHYRHSRRLQPNTLRLALLREEDMRIIPHYLSFVEQADAAVKGVATFLLYRFQPTIKDKAEFFRQQFVTTGEKYKLLRKKYFGEEEIRGWHTTIHPRTDLLPEEVSFMTYMLMDNAGPGTER